MKWNEMLLRRQRQCDPPLQLFQLRAIIRVVKIRNHEQPQCQTLDRGHGQTSQESCPYVADFLPRLGIPLPEVLVLLFLSIVHGIPVLEEGERDIIDPPPCRGAVQSEHHLKCISRFHGKKYRYL